MFNDVIVLYDMTGRILAQISTIEEPVGVPFLKISLPLDKYVISIDVSGEEPKAILGDCGKTPTQILEERQLESELIIDYRLSVLELGLI